MLNSQVVINLFVLIKAFVFSLKIIVGITIRGCHLGILTSTTHEYTIWSLNLMLGNLHGGLG